jgi:flagellar biosynthesis protein FlhA
MPHVAFLGLSVVAGAGAFFIYWRKNQDEAQEVTDKDTVQKKAEDESKAEPSELGWGDVTPVDVIGLEVGYRLIPMVDKSQGGQVLSRIKGIRKKLSQELGFLVPSVHIRDNLDLSPNEYRITLMGVQVGTSEIYPERDMAINPGQVFGKASGLPTKDPAFGLDALWIESSQKEHVQTLGYTVVDSSTVIATHMNTLLQKHAHELLGHEEIHELLTMLGKTSKKLAEELPSQVNTNVLLKVLQNLLKENVSIRDMRTIAEALAAASVRSQDPVVLTAAARIALSRVIVQSIYGSADELPVITLDSALEQILLKSVQQAAKQNPNGASDEGMVIEPAMAERLQQSLLKTSNELEASGSPAVLLVPAPLRSVLSKFVRFTVSGLKVLSYQEVPDNKQITIVASVGQK